jgi:hypothetical protein
MDTSHSDDLIIKKDDLHEIYFQRKKWWKSSGDYLPFHFFSNMMTQCLHVLDTTPHIVELIEIKKIVDTDFDSTMKKECRLDYTYMYGDGQWDVRSAPHQTGYVDLIKSYVAKFTKVYLAQHITNTSILRHICSVHDTFLTQPRTWPDADLDLLNTIVTTHMKTRREFSEQSTRA